MSFSFTLIDEVRQAHPDFLKNQDQPEWSLTIARILPHWAALLTESHQNGQPTDDPVCQLNAQYIQNVFSSFCALFPRLRLPSPLEQVKLKDLNWKDLCNADPPSAVQIMQNFRLKTPVMHGQVKGEYLSLKAALLRLIDLKRKKGIDEVYAISIFPDINSKLIIEIVFPHTATLERAAKDPALTYLISRLAGEMSIRKNKEEETKLIIELPVAKGQNDDPDLEQYVEKEQLQEVYQRICDWLDQEKAYLQNGLTISEMSTALDISERTISRCIKLFSDQNYQAFLNRYRIAEAKRLLLDEDHRYSYLGIAMEAGFGSKSAFYMTFKTVTGITPKAFVARAKVQNGHAKIQKKKTSVDS